MAHYIPVSPSDKEWDELKEKAKNYNVVLVQVSERKYQIAQISYFRQGNVLIPCCRFISDEKFSHLSGLKEMERIIVAKYGK